MECNRDEAVRVKEMAEKLLEKDIIGSRKLALKAQSLFPELQGLLQFLEIVDVYMAHNQTINGEPNYYRVLGVDPSSDDEMLKEYRRKALSLHPDKNKSVGADRAFIILSDAWRVLSDKESRNANNMKLFNSFSLQSTPGSGTTSQPYYSASASHPGRNTAFQHPACHAPAVSSRYTPPSCYPGSTTHTAPAGSPYGPPRSPLNLTPPTGPRKRKTPTTTSLCCSVCSYIEATHSGLVCSFKKSANIQRLPIRITDVLDGVHLVLHTVRVQESLPKSESSLSSL